MHSMITMHARPRETDRRTNIMATARRFVRLTHRALKKCSLTVDSKCYSPILYNKCMPKFRMSVWCHVKYLF